MTAPAVDATAGPPDDAAAADPGDTGVLSSLGFRIGRWVVGGLAGAYTVSTLVPLNPRPPWLDTTFYSAVLLLVAASTLVRPLLVRRDRIGWLCLAAAVSSWAVGDVYWAATFADADEIPVPSLADGFYLGFYPLAYLGFVLLARAVARRLPASVWLDGVVTSLAVGAVFTALTLKEIISAAKGSLAEVGTNLSYPVGDLLLMVLAFAVLAMLRWRRDPMWWLLAGGCALFAVADTAYLFGVARGTYNEGSWVDGFWMAGLALVPLASSVRPAPRTTQIRGFAALVLPILFSLSALIVLLVGTAVRLHPVSIALAGGCLVAAGVRTALTFEQTRALARSRQEARTDELTRLGNRRLLEEALPSMARRLGPSQQLLFTLVSVDHLAEVNSAIGYPAGDVLLATVGARLRDTLPATATSVRLGGAELAVLQPIEGGPALAERFVRGLLDTVSRAAPPPEVPVEIELSAGIALCPQHAEEADDLLRCANDALRRAKANRSGLEVYEPALDVAREFGPALVPDLIRALDTSQLVAYYQPKVDVGTGTATDLEAVPRWHHPTRGVLTADTVYALAGRSGQTRRVTRALLAEAVRRCAGWQQLGLPLGVAVDLAVADVLDSRLPYDLARMISDSGLAPRAVQLEIAEDVLLIDPARTQRALGQLRSFGVRLALDHYGRAAPSLVRLRTTPVDELKLDPAFARSVLQSSQDAAVVRSTVDLAASLGMRTVAEGVDSAELYERLSSYDLAGMQGAVFGEPMAPAALATWLGESDRPPVGQPVG